MFCGTREYDQKKHYKRIKKMVEIEAGDLKWVKPGFPFKIGGYCALLRACRRDGRVAFARTEFDSHGDPLTGAITGTRKIEVDNVAYEEEVTNHITDMISGCQYITKETINGKSVRLLSLKKTTIQLYVDVRPWADQYRIHLAACETERCKNRATHVINEGEKYVCKNCAAESSGALIPIEKWSRECG